MSPGSVQGNVSGFSGSGLTILGSGSGLGFKMHKADGDLRIMNTLLKPEWRIVLTKYLAQIPPAEGEAFRPKAHAHTQEP